MNEKYKQSLALLSELESILGSDDVAMILSAHRPTSFERANRAIRRARALLKENDV